MENSLVTVSRSSTLECCVFMLWQTATSKGLQALHWQFPEFAMCHSGSYTTNTSSQKWCELSVTKTTLWPSLTVKKHARARARTHTDTELNNQYFQSFTLYRSHAPKQIYAHISIHSTREFPHFNISLRKKKHISSQHSLNAISTFWCFLYAGTR
jgi:hypothetical protein